MDTTVHWTPLLGKRPTPAQDARAPLCHSPPPALERPTSCPLAPPSRPLGASEFVAQFKTPLLFRSMTLGTFHLKEPQEVSFGKVMKV